MKNKTSCYTYFTITGDFNPEDVTKLLNIQPFKKWNKGDVRNKNLNDMYDFSRWSACKCDEYDVIVENQMRRTITPLLDKINLLNEFRKNNNVHFSLVIVPEIYPDEITPCISPSLDIMDFCTATRTELDIDYYIYK